MKGRIGLSASRDSMSTPKHNPNSEMTTTHERTPLYAFDYQPLDEDRNEIRLLKVQESTANRSRSSADLNVSPPMGRW